MGPKARSSSSSSATGFWRTHAQGKPSCGVSVLRQPRVQNRLSPSGLDPFREAFREFSRRQTLRTNMRKTEVRKMMKTQGSTMEFTERKRRALRSAFSLKSAAKAPMYTRICQKSQETGKNEERSHWSWEQRGSCTDINRSLNPSISLSIESACVLGSRL